MAYVDGGDEEDDAPTAAPRPNGELACEIRRVGDKEVAALRFPGGRGRCVSRPVVSVHWEAHPQHPRGPLAPAASASGTRRESTVGADDELPVAARGLEALG